MRNTDQGNIVEDFKCLNSVIDLERFEEDLKNEEEFVKAVSNIIVVHMSCNLIHILKCRKYYKIVLS